MCAQLPVIADPIGLSSMQSAATRREISSRGKVCRTGPSREIVSELRRRSAREKQLEARIAAVKKTPAS